MKDMEACIAVLREELVPAQGCTEPIALTWSYSMADASEVSIFNYSGILFSMLFSSLFLGQAVKASSALGAALVILAGTITLIGQKRAEKGDARGAV